MARPSVPGATEHVLLVDHSQGTGCRRHGLAQSVATIAKAAPLVPVIARA